MTQLQVGRIGRAHGIRGEVTVTPFTDDPSARFAVGSELQTDSSARPVLVVSGARQSGPVQVVGFEGIVDRNTAETLRGIHLLVDAESLPEPADEDEFYDHQLIGLAVHHHVSGEVLGEIVDVMHPPAAPVLVVRRPDDTEELVPFVSAIVPDVDLAARHVTVDLPDGMFE
ncbi:16S rRNA processing protein RimM [Nakamurella sp. UYEF19]|uniref:ribosome maturation factor RimM n=1 Tax=Nakamurella sp. UYEF19 TaxID=1756392 RepID=UPI0033980030